MPGEADASHPVKQAQFVKSDTEMWDLMCAMEDCRTQLQYLMGRISKYMDNMEASTDERYNYIAAYLGGLQKQSMAALMAVQIFIDWYWDEKERATDEGLETPWKEFRAQGHKLNRCQRCRGPRRGRHVARRGEQVSKEWMSSRKLVGKEWWMQRGMLSEEYSRQKLRVQTFRLPLIIVPAPWTLRRSCTSFFNIFTFVLCHADK